jgi:hypothetical protein
MPKYLVCFSESPFEEQEFKIVNASSKSEARAFFGRHRDYAELYINHYFSEEDSPRMDRFPEEMLIYILVNSDYSDVTAVKLDDIGEI